MHKPEKILPLLFLPPLEYFCYLINSKEVSFEVMETYTKQTYRNRCTIYSANGLLDLSIAVNKPYGNHTMTKDIIISGLENWKVKFQRAIDSAYNASPYFMFYKDEIMEELMLEENHLYKFNLRLIQKICSILDIELNYELTGNYIKEYEPAIDNRDHFNPKKKDKQIHFPEYTQVFSEKFGFKENLSIIDLLFNLGPESRIYLKNCTV